VIDSFGGSETSNVVDIVHTAQVVAPASSVRKAFWQLVQKGRIRLFASGRVVLVPNDGEKK